MSPKKGSNQYTIFIALVLSVILLISIVAADGNINSFQNGYNIQASNKLIISPWSIPISIQNLTRQSSSSINYLIDNSNMNSRITNNTNNMKILWPTTQDWTTRISPPSFFINGPTTACGTCGNSFTNLKFFPS